jgi:hypothetical protein
VSLFCLANYSFCFASTLSPHCKSSTFSDNTFTLKANSFSVYEQVYLKIYCEGLSQGEHRINTEWIDNQGGLQRSDSHIFLLKKRQDYSCFFQFKLMPKGSLLRMLSGNDFDDEQYGQWAVLIYVDNHQIGRNEFSLNDD